MTATNHCSDVWQLDDTSAALCCPGFSAQVDLLDPRAGLSGITRNDLPIDGAVLGVAPGNDTAIAECDIHDAYVRGNDLVVTYSETEQRPFSLQVYWRATAAEQGVTELDMILSLQTELLESFPGVAVETVLPAGKHAELTVDASEQSRALAGILFRAAEANYSYAEITHPEDRGELTHERGEDSMLHLRRQLGGHFLEKGVIRRLRVRGVFLPRENDQQTAAKYLAGLITAEPPLTV